MRVAGIGCRKGVAVGDVLAAVEAALAALLQQHRPTPSLVNSKDLCAAQAQEFTFSPAKGEKEAPLLRHNLPAVEIDGLTGAGAFLPLGGGESDFNGLAGAKRRLSVRNRKSAGLPILSGDTSQPVGGAEAPHPQIDALATAASKGDEPGIAGAAEFLGLPLITVSECDLKRVSARCLTRSAASLAATGVPSLAEAAALAAVGEEGRLLGPRIATGNVTCAIAQDRDDT
ncbi:cobalamin biosynthesis protein [Chelativorans sp. M5D2P16]|uniref:cobalamin biosynthesis protein n=1 Tax=Chelativorans sp. M5D2P16 TaxID=3095678 RepID=UPI002ACA78A7|nr:cobalamin biosynthesis protein [Chelativorans sp. M5D2P16]MDZ5695864.1 cobalamin biosynthesis protein [Chelativorans sp. M5D2P16]